MGASLLAELREATRQAHTAVERVPALARLLAADLTRAEYGATLVRLHRFHAALEPRLREVLAAVPEVAPCLASGRACALAADLRALGLAVPQPAPGRALPALPDPAAGLGCLYVMEGSALGGRVIARRLAETLGVTPGDGAAFFGSESAEAVRARWLAFCAGIEAAGARLPAEGRRRLLQAAVASFSSLGAWMTETGAQPLPAAGEERAVADMLHATG